MNLDSLPGLLLAWLKTQGSQLLQTQAGTGKSGELPFRPGESYQGRVMENLANGRSLVKVADQVLDMALPRPTGVGASVRLTYLNAAPRPTFLLDQGPVQATQAVRLSGAAQQVNALIRLAGTPPPAQNPSSAVPAAAAPVSAPAAAASAMSGAGQVGKAQPATTGVLVQRPVVVNASLLQAPRAGAGATPTTMSTVVTTQPTAVPNAGTVEGLRAAIASGTALTTQVIWDQPGQASHVLPLRLRQVLRESGLFYESHQARWVRGETGLEALEREPQARLARLEVPASSSPELKGMPEETARLAGRQLMMLEGQPFVWQGQAWPGQSMEWLVEEGEPDGRQEADGPAWRTVLRLLLPRLGELEAELHLTPKGLRVTLHAGEEAHVREIQAALPDLTRRLEEAQLNPTAINLVAGDG